MLKAIFSEMKNILLICFRYVAVTAIIALITMSFLAGKFPPPVKEMYSKFRALQSSVKIEDVTFGLKQIQNQKQTYLQQIESEELNQVSPESVQSGNINLKPEDKIKALEYEVAYLKARLQASEWQNEQLKKQLPSNTRE